MNKTPTCERTSWLSYAKETHPSRSRGYSTNTHQNTCEASTSAMKRYTSTYTQVRDGMSTCTHTCGGNNPGDGNNEPENPGKPRFYSVFPFMSAPKR